MAADNISPIIAQVLSDSSTINAACDGLISSGNPGNTPQDANLEGPHETSIFVRRISKTEEGYLGSVTTGDYKYDLLIQVDVLSKASEATAFDLADKVEALLKSTTSKLFNGATVPLHLSLASRSPQFDDQLGAWLEMLRFRAIGVYVSA